MKKVLSKLKLVLTEPSVTSFGDNVYRPRWYSVISDFICFFSFGLIKPRRRKHEKCCGDIDFDN